MKTYGLKGKMSGIKKGARNRLKKTDVLSGIRSKPSK